MGLLKERLVQHGLTGNVEIEKNKLLEAVRSNKEEHIVSYNESASAYEKAKMAYALEFTKQLENTVKEAKKKLDKKLIEVQTAVGIQEKAYHEEIPVELKDVNAYVDLKLQPKVQLTVNEPENHEKDYITAIRNLELSSAEFVSLSQQDFKQYILDEWTWKETFEHNNFLAISGCTMTGNLHVNNMASGISLIGSGCSTIGESYVPYETPIYTDGLDTTNNSSIIGA